MVTHRKKKCLSLVFCDRWVVFCTVIIKSILCLAFALSLNFEVYVVYIYEDRDSEFQIALMLPACSKQILPNKNNTIWMFFFQDKPRKGVFVYLFHFVLEELFNTLSCYHPQDDWSCNWMNAMIMTSITYLVTSSFYFDLSRSVTPDAVPCTGPTFLWISIHLRIHILNFNAFLYC